MELIRKNIHMSRQKRRAVWQMTIDEDSNVSDSLPDVQKLICHKGMVEIGETKAETDRVRLRGALRFAVLYGTGEEDGIPRRLTGKIPIEEPVHMEGAQEGEQIQVKWELEDLRISLVHSRKINVKALITFELTAEEVADEEMAVGIAEGQETEVRMRPVSVAALAAQKRDTCRIRDEIILPMNQPNIQEILWQETALRGVDTRLGEGQVTVKGELQIFVLYQGEEEPAKTWWLSQSVPFNAHVDCPGCQEQMAGHVEVSVLRGDVEAKPDYDGELRVLNLDAILDVNMKVYSEEHLNMICDLYSPARELNIQSRPAFCERLLVANASRCHVLDRLPLGGDEAPVLQICSSTGEVKIDEVTITEQGLKVEGVVEARALYVTSDDRFPYCSLNKTVPFEHLLEVPGLGEKPVYYLHASLEQLMTALIGGEEVEIKAAVLINAMVLEPQELLHIDQVEEQPLDLERIKNLPGVLVYVVQPQDTLWDIAKTYHTTVEQVRSLNDLGQQEVKEGQRLLLVKQMGSL